MQVFQPTTHTAENARLYMAYQAKRGVVPPAGDPGSEIWWDMDIEGGEIGRNVGYRRIRSARAGREESRPERETVDAPQSFSGFLDKRQVGFHLGALFGAATVTDANAWGFVQFENGVPPEDGMTIVLDGVTWTFVASGAAGNETEIGASLAATVVALAADLNASGDTDISAATYVAEGHRLRIEHDSAGVGGNAFTLGAGTSEAYVSAPTLQGGGLKRHVFASGAKALPLVSMISDQSDLALADGPRWKAVHNLRWGGMQFDIARTGAAGATYTAIGANERALAADPGVDARLVDAGIDRFSQLQGGIMVDDACICGVIETGRVSIDNGLISDRTMCCPGHPDAGGIDDALPGPSTVGLTVNARYYDPQLAGKAEADEDVKIVLQYFDPADGMRLTFTFPQVTLPETTRNLPAAGGAIVQNFNAIASAPDNGNAVTVELVNDIAGY